MYDCDDNNTHRFWIELREELAALTTVFWSMEGPGGIWKWHECDICCQLVPRQDGIGYNKLTALMLDGISFGPRTCRSCAEPPAPGRNSRFCVAHAEEETVCGLNDCRSQCMVNVASGKRSLACENHQEELQQFLARKTFRGRFATTHRRNKSAFMRRDAGESTPREESVEIRGQQLPFRHGFDVLRCASNMCLTRSCAIIVSRETMRDPEFNNLKGVTECLEKMLPASEGARPKIMVYDQNCGLWQYMLANDKAWESTIFIVDWFHFLKHSSADEWCIHNCSPGETSRHAHLLYKRSEDGTLVFIWNSSMAEVTNSWLTGFSKLLKVSHMSWHDTILNNACLAHNEIHLWKNMKHNPSFSLP